MGWIESFDQFVVLLEGLVDQAAQMTLKHAISTISPRAKWSVAARRRGLIRLLPARCAGVRPMSVSAHSRWRASRPAAVRLSTSTTAPPRVKLRLKRLDWLHVFRVVQIHHLRIVRCASQGAISTAYLRRAVFQPAQELILGMVGLRYSPGAPILHLTNCIRHRLDVIQRLDRTRCRQLQKPAHPP